MFRLQHCALIALLAVPLVCAVPATQAQGLSVSTGTPVNLDGFSTEQRETATQLVEVHQLRLEIHRSLGELSRQDFDRLFTDLVEDLDRMLTPGFLADKSGSACSQACKGAETGTLQICNADAQAAIALAACPTSTFAVKADLSASVACLVASLQTAPTTCMGPASQQLAIDLLEDSKQQSLEAWSDAAYAWVQDGCDESEETANQASLAYFSFHNAKTQMASCN